MTHQRDPKLETTLARYMNQCSLRGPVHAFGALGSTMDEAHALAAHGSPEGTLVFAATQTHGRGRLGRAWASPSGGAYWSVILRPTRHSGEVPQLALVAGLSLAEAVRQIARLSPSIRWPNDLLVEGRKLAGILAEAKNGAVVVGVGVNVTTSRRALPATATSLYAATKQRWHPYQVVGAFWRRFSVWYDSWSTHGFSPIRIALRPWIGLFGHPVKLTAGRNQLEGTASDLDEDGRLVVRLDSGLRRAFDAGEITLLRSTV